MPKHASCCKLDFMPMGCMGVSGKNPLRFQNKYSFSKMLWVIVRKPVCQISFALIVL